MTPDTCPLCHAPASYLETLHAVEFFCAACGEVFLLDADGKLVRRHRTNHSKAKRTTDINGYPIDE